MWRTGGGLLFVVLGVLAARAGALERLAIFDDPRKACRLLAGEGFDPADWESGPGGWACSSTREHIEFVVTGDEPLAAKRLKLILRVDAERTQDQTARTAQLERVAGVLLTRLGLKLTPELREAIRGTKQHRERLAGANVTFDAGLRPYDQQVLIIRDPTIRVVAIPRQPEVRMRGTGEPK